MNTKTIFKMLAAAMLMPAMLLTTACSSDDDAVNDNAKKEYILPVTVTVTRQDGEGTRTTFNSSTKELEFSTGDVLFIKGQETTAGLFYAELTYAGSNTFSGELHTSNAYTGTADALLAAASEVHAHLLPAGYGTYGYVTLSGESITNRSLVYDETKAFVTSYTPDISKPKAIEQFSKEKADAYSSGFALEPANAVLSYSISGLAADAVYSGITVSDGSTTITGTATADGSGHAYFAVAFVPAGSKTYTLSIPGFADITVADRTLEAGKVYTKTATAALPAVTYTAPTLRSGSSNYNGSAQNLLATTGSATGGTIYYSVNGGSWSDKAQATDAGTYTVRYKVEPNTGYTGIGETPLGSFTINKVNWSGSVTVSWTVGGYQATYNGSGTIIKWEYYANGRWNPGNVNNNNKSDAVSGATSWRVTLAGDNNHNQTTISN